jgi:endoglycosylceramidase
LGAVLAIGLLAVVLPAGSAARAARARALPVLTHQGRWLTDPQGRVVILHGVQVDKWRASSPVNVVDLSPANVRFIAASGFNLVRLSITFSGIEPAPSTFDQSYIDGYQSFDAELAAAGVYDLLNLMQGEYSQAVGGWGFPDWMTVIGAAPNTKTPFPNGYFLNPAEDVAWTSFWNNTPTGSGLGLQQAYIAGLRRLATNFAHAPALLGIEILNEPWPGVAWPTCASPLGCPAFDGTAFTSFYRAAARALRSADPTHLIAYEPNLLFNNGAQTQLGTVGDANALFAFHNYCLDSIAGGIEGLPNGRSPSDPLQLCGLDENLVLNNAVAHAASTGDALLMDEWGNSADVTVLERMASEADRHMVGWSYWGYEDCCGSAGAIVKDGTRSPNAPGNLNTSVLDALVRPYPQAVAGTPTGWSYDPSTHRFELTYSTQRVGGGTFASGTLTTVEVPRLDYPHGYAVSVRGGRVVSAPDADHLMIAAASDAQTVTVVVS